jgi:multisubunit Na+/H+ antiporter MnhB subunit
MSMLEQPSRRARRRGRRDAIGRIVLTVVGLALAFLLGIAFARTLDERPDSSGTETIVRTLTPLPLEAPARTVTMTVTTP